METEGPAPSDGEVGEHPDRLPSENRIGRRTDMEKTKNVRKRGLTPFPPTLAVGIRLLSLYLQPTYKICLERDKLRAEGCWLGGEDVLR